MKNRISYPLLAQRLFQVLFVVAVIGLLSSVVITGLSNFSPILPSKREQLPDAALGVVVAFEIIPLLHYLFFTLFFYYLAKLFRSFGTHRSFSQHTVRSSRLLGVGCLLYAALNLLEMSLEYLMYSNFGTQIISSYYVNKLFISTFVGNLALVFFLQHQVHQEASRLQAENELTI